MDSEGFLIWLGAVGVGLVIGGAALLVRFIRDAGNMPDEAQQQSHIREIQRLQRQGHGYAQRLAYLQSQGLRRNVADHLLGEAQRLESVDESGQTSDKG